MDKYAIYNFELMKRRVIQGDLTRGEEIDVPKMEHAHENFDHVFGGKGTEVRIQREKRRGEGADKFPCHVIAHDHNIVLLRLENVKSVTVYESHKTEGPVPSIEKKKYESNPPCFIIIDNREGKTQIAIQIDSAAWSKTNIVRDLLEENLDRELEPFGLTIKIRSKMQKSEYWDYVTYRQRKEGRGIKRMTFQFPNVKIRPSIETSIGLSNHLKMLMELVNKLGAGQGELSIQPPTNDYLLKKRLNDIKNIVALCSSSADYSLSVTFDDDITYRCNENLRAELPMNIPRAIENFKNGQLTTFFEYDLERWLDWVVEQTEQYQDAEQIKPKPDREDQRKVS
jgi:hypothetical protein